MKPHTGFEVYNGIRTVHLFMKKDVPDLVQILGEKKRVSYEGMTQSCFRCHQTGHKRFDCPNGPQARLERPTAQSTGYISNHNEFPRLPLPANLLNNSNDQSNSSPRSLVSDTLSDSNRLTMEQIIERTKQYAQQVINKTDDAQKNLQLQLDNSDGNQQHHTKPGNEKKIFTLPKPVLDEKPNGEHNARNRGKNTANSKTKDDDLLQALSEQQRAKLRDRSRRSADDKKSGERSRSNSSGKKENTTQ